MTCTSTTTSSFESPSPPPMITSHCYSPPMQALFNASISRGWISYEEINTCLPDEMLDAEEMDLLLDRLDRSNVTFIDQPTVEREERDTYFAAAGAICTSSVTPRTGSEPVFMQEEPDASRRSNWVKTDGFDHRRIGRAGSRGH